MDNNKVAQYIAKQRSPQREICEQLRKIITNTFPGIKEEMKWGVPAYDNGKYYFVALKDHVNLGFSLKGLSKEETGFFEGGGKTMKHLKIHSLGSMNEDEIIHLMKLIKDR